MKVVFRADASLQIGSGHIMRCLTLADTLRERGAQCHFICRDHYGHLIELVRHKGYSVHVLPMGQSDPLLELGPVHAVWLGATKMQDAEACRTILQDLQPDWLIVDHYALDIQWEVTLKPFCRHLMAIDDLADRSHDCELLLDQNLGRQAYHYQGMVPAHCTVLAGPQYALLRPEFAALRNYSLKRRQAPSIRNILITMGGVDQSNATSRVLKVLQKCSLPEDCRIRVVMGAKAPWLEQVRIKAAEMPWPTEVFVNVGDMGQQMADCDLAIGAAGSTSWERCCLGVPTLMLILAENQAAIGFALQRSEAATLLGMPNDANFEEHCVEALLTLIQTDGRLSAMSKAAAEVTDGTGCSKVAQWLLNE